MAQTNSSLQHFEKEISWEEKARINPLYAVMSEDIFQTAEAQPTQQQLELFYQKGKRIWNKYFGGVFSQFSDPTRIQVLEYGCGMGRVLHVPATLGANCVGVDISTTQLGLARKYMPGQEKAQFVPVIPQTKLNLPDRSIDFVYSFAVLQHILKASDFLFALSEMVRVARPAGVLKLQLPYEAPIFDKRYRMVRKFSYETSSLLVYLKKDLFYMPVIRLVKHDNWGGAAYYYKFEKLILFLKSQSVHINEVTFDEGGFALITATKQ